jgi:hypothetical protein
MRKLSRDLRSHADGKSIRPRMIAKLKKVSDGVVQAERAAVLALPSKGESARRGRTPLRRRVARATVSQVRTVATNPRVSVMVDRTRMPDGQANLPAYMNAEPRYTRWRHQVFNTGTYVNQAPMPWFYRTAQPFELQAQRQLLQVLDEVAAELERG